MFETLIGFFLVWGVWLLMPILVDGLQTLFRTFVVMIWGRNFINHRVKDEDLPYISVIVPAHNESQIIARCLDSIKIQDYPHKKLQILVVENGSTDDTKEVVERYLENKNGNGNGNGYTNGNGAYKNGNGYSHLKINGKFIEVPEFSGNINLLSTETANKSIALNFGINQAKGDLIITLDCDVVLAPDALKNMAIHFIENPRVGAATGNIEISEEMIEDRDRRGNLLLNDDGSIKYKKLNWFEYFLTRCQFLEYLDAFRFGRQYQAIIDSTQILAGAFSAFRKEILLKSRLYRDHTVSEDFDLTLALLDEGLAHIGYVADSKAYVEPVYDFDTLYSQRVRWHRGQMEACSLHRRILSYKFGKFRFGITEMLVSDHTLAFPRLVWSILILLFPLFGYHYTIIIGALLLSYAFYTFISLTQAILAYSIVDNETKSRIERSLAYALILPLYRFITFYFRLSGYLIALQEKQTWDIPGPISVMKNRTNGLRNNVIGLLTLSLNNLKLSINTRLSIAKWMYAIRLYKLSFAYIESQLNRAMVNRQHDEIERILEFPSIIRRLKNEKEIRRFNILYNIKLIKLKLTYKLARTASLYKLNKTSIELYEEAMNNALALKNKYYIDNIFKDIGNYQITIKKRRVLLLLPRRIISQTVLRLLGILGLTR